MHNKPLILGINGSPYKTGIVAELLDMVVSGAQKAGAETKTIHLYDLKIDYDSGYYSRDPRLATVKNIPSDDMKDLYPVLRQADGIVLATPVYWANMSGAMKNFLDRLTPLENDGFSLQGKVAAFIAASKENEGGGEMAAMAMAAALLQMGVMILPNGVMWYPGKWVTSEKQEESWARSDAPKVGRNMVHLLELLRQSPIGWDK